MSSDINSLYCDIYQKRFNEAMISIDILPILATTTINLIDLSTSNFYSTHCACAHTQHVQKRAHTPAVVHYALSVPLVCDEGPLTPRCMPETNREKAYEREREKNVTKINQHRKGDTSKRGNMHRVHLYLALYVWLQQNQLQCLDCKWEVRHMWQPCEKLFRNVTNCTIWNRAALYGQNSTQQCWLYCSTWDIVTRD